MKKVAILQSNYIPWKGYFDLIAAVDEFIIYDDMQFTKNDWRNRNKIKTPTGLQWLTIPVGVDINRKIREVVLPYSDWRVKHLKSLEINYGRTKYFDKIIALIKPIYMDKSIETLTEFNRALIDCICNYLNIKTKVSYSWDYALGVGKSERLVGLCLQANAQIYISGPGARDYLDVQLFKDSQIKIEWFDYTGYPEYPQLWSAFEHSVSILDLMFNCGLKSSQFMKFSKGI